MTPLQTWHSLYRALEVAEGGPHVTITHDALDLPIHDPPPDMAITVPLEVALDLDLVAKGI